MRPRSGDVCARYSFVGMRTGGAAGGLQASHRVTALAQRVDAWSRPAGISPLGFAIIKILGFHLEVFVRRTMLIFCGIRPLSDIMSLVHGLACLLFSLVKRLLLLPQGLVLLVHLLVAVFKVVPCPLLILGKMCGSIIRTQSYPLLDTVILEVICSRLVPHLLLLLLK